MFLGAGQRWELSAHSLGSSHCTFHRQCSLRWSSTGPSGDPFSCSWSPDPEASQGTQAWDTQQATPSPHAHLASVSKAPRLSLPECATDLTRIFISDNSRATQKQREEGRRMSNHGHKVQTNKQTNKKPCLLPVSDHLFGFFWVPGDVFPLRNVIKEFSYCLKKNGGGAWINK